MVATIGGVRQIVTFSESLLVGVAADRGELLWKVPFTTSWVQNAVTPIVHGDTVVYSGLDTPVRAVRIVRRASGWATEVLWENADVAAYMSTPVLGGRIYGLSHHKRGQLFCLDATTGRAVWLSEGRQGENAALVAGGGAVFVLTTDADLVVVPQKGDTFAPVRRYRVASSPTWAHPVVTNEGVLVKDRESLAYVRF
jgi:outer membrane protein assembly factor BamB